MLFIPISVAALPTSFCGFVVEQDDNAITIVQVTGAETSAEGTFLTIGDRAILRTEPNDRPHDTSDWLLDTNPRASRIPVENVGKQGAFGSLLFTPTSAHAVRNAGIVLRGPLYVRTDKDNKILVKHALRAKIKMTAVALPNFAELRATASADA